MRLKKFIAILSMALVGLFTFSSCGRLINQENAVERISAIQPEKQVNRTVFMKDKSLLIEIEGERKKINLLSEIAKYYDFDEDGVFIDSVSRYRDWIYYIAGEYETEFIVEEGREYKTKVIFLRTNIYTGETEKIYDYGKVNQDLTQNFGANNVYGGQYYFLYMDGVLQIFDMEANLFTYEHRLLDENLIEENIDNLRDIDGYKFGRNYDNEERSMDYIKDGVYYYYENGGYQIKTVPDWVIEKNGRVDNLEGRVYSIKNYLYIRYSYILADGKVEWDGKGYDLDLGEEVDYSTVLDIKYKSWSYSNYNNKEGNLIGGDYVYVELDGKAYQARRRPYIGWVTTSYIDIYQVEIDEKEGRIGSNHIEIEAQAFRDNHTVIKQLCNAWWEYRKGHFTFKYVGFSQDRIFFTCYNYYGNFFGGTYTREFLCEVDPVTGKAYYLGYYEEPYENCITEVYVH